MSPNHDTNRARHPATGEPVEPGFQELVDYFVGELPAKVQRLEQAAQLGDLATIRTLAHQLKGCSAGYGFAALGEQAALLEMHIDEPDGHAAEINKVRGDVESLIALCNSYCTRKP